MFKCVSSIIENSCGMIQIITWKAKQTAEFIRKMITQKKKNDKLPLSAFRS